MGQHMHDIPQTALTVLFCWDAIEPHHCLHSIIRAARRQLLNPLSDFLIGSEREVRGREVLVVDSLVASGFIFEGQIWDNLFEEVDQLRGN